MTGLPDTVKLLPTYDVDALRADLAAVEARFRSHTNPLGDYSNEGDAGGWDVLLLRCPGGDPEKAGRGDGGTEDFADTPYLALTPYVREIIDSLQVPVRGVRFSSLAAGSTVGEHTDRPYGLPVGWVRLHVPVFTSDDAVLIVNGAENRWKPGEFWYANFGLPHSLYNHGAHARVHLIIDCYISAPLAELFPVAMRPEILAADVMHFRAERTLPDGLTGLRGEIRIPASFFAAYSDPPTEQTWRARGRRDDAGRWEVRDGRVVLSLGGREAAMAYIGDGEFRPLCWSQERTLEVRDRGDGRWIVFRYRSGDHVRETARKQPALVG